MGWPLGRRLLGGACPFRFPCCSPATPAGVVSCVSCLAGAPRSAAPPRKAGPPPLRLAVSQPPVRPPFPPCAG
eukprot:209250-Chlamydomonas_euryale.AAC.1